MFACPPVAAVCAEKASPSQAELKPAKQGGSHPREARRAPAPPAASGSTREVSGCVAGWYREARMTTDEWRSACERAFADKGMSAERQLSLCMEGWEPATHMTKREWEVVCRRSLQR